MTIGHRTNGENSRRCRWGRSENAKKVSGRVRSSACYCSPSQPLQHLCSVIVILLPPSCDCCPPLRPSLLPSFHVAALTPASPSRPSSSTSSPASPPPPRRSRPSRPPRSPGKRPPGPPTGSSAARSASAASSTGRRRRRPRRHSVSLGMPFIVRSGLGNRRGVGCKGGAKSKRSRGAVDVVVGEGAHCSSDWCPKPSAEIHNPGSSTIYTLL